MLEEELLLLVPKKLDRNGMVGIDLRTVPLVKGWRALYWVETREL